MSEYLDRDYTEEELSEFSREQLDRIYDNAEKMAEDMDKEARERVRDEVGTQSPLVKTINEHETNILIEHKGEVRRIRVWDLLQHLGLNYLQIKAMIETLAVDIANGGYEIVNRSTLPRTSGVSRKADTTKVFN